MSRWVRGIYNAAANFVMSGSLRAASSSTMDRNRKLVRQELNKPYECDESDKSCESHKSDNECGSDTDCLGCAPFSCARYDPNSNHYIGEHTEYDNRDKDGIEARDKDRNKIRNEARDKHTFVDPEFGVKSSGAGTIRSEGQGASSGVRFSNEPRNT